MNAPTGRLFREEVLAHRADRLHGEVSINVPVSWHLIGSAAVATGGSAAIVGGLLITFTLAVQ